MGTFVVGAILIVIVVLIIRYLIRHKKTTHSCVGCSCAQNCPYFNEKH
ncbi:MAG: FeoB-associated Cys-rich membrane protein [Lachnospiraceae bacterium]|nr:FeoB-associated Cys-rich membrane protein [Lachnospiraceae bacterium]